MKTTFYTISEVADKLRMTTDYIYRLTRTGKLGHYKIGSSVRITQEQLEAFLASKRVYNKSEVGQQADTRIAIG